MNIIRISRPDLPAEEREKRMHEIKQAAIDLITATEKAKLRKEKQT
jgi:hypothetical protein